MFNILSYIGVNLQSELCLWTLLGLLRTIFDATLFKVNANLKQVWQMSMPAELSMPVQRGLRTMISGIMLLQCFSVYVYLASYIILLYPVFLEERPALVLPWLLLAAIRKLLCELTSLALGLGICVLLGPARPACVRFLIVKIANITPAFYMWLLVFSYYNTLRVASKFKTPVGMATSDHDYGLELAVRRRRTKSLLDENVLRRKLVASLNYGERPSEDLPTPLQLKQDINVRMVHSTSADSEDIKAEMSEPTSSLTDIPAERVRSDVGSYYEDWFGSESIVPRDTDRILEQFATMMLRIGVYMEDNEADPTKLFSSHSKPAPKINSLECSNLANGTETPPAVSSRRGKVASYVENYPQIFMKKPSTEHLLIPPELSIMQEQQSDESRERGQMMPVQIYPKLTETSPSVSSDTERDNISVAACDRCKKENKCILKSDNTKGGVSINVQEEPVRTSCYTNVTGKNTDPNPVDRTTQPSELPSTSSAAPTRRDNATQSSDSLQILLDRMKHNLPGKHSDPK